MKRTKIILLISLLMAFLFIFCSCRCYPNMFDWDVSVVKTYSSEKMREAYVIYYIDPVE